MNPEQVGLMGFCGCRSRKLVRLVTSVVSKALFFLQCLGDVSNFRSCLWHCSRCLSLVFSMLFRAFTWDVF